jgi:hypothetical protein
MSRSRSADALDTRSLPLALAHRKSISDTTPGDGNADKGDPSKIMPESLLLSGNTTHDYLGNAEDDDDSIDVSHLTLNTLPGFAFGSSFSFPAPPSALPAPPRPPVARINGSGVPCSPGLSSPSHLASGTSSPAMASTPNLGSFKHDLSSASLASTFNLASTSDKDSDHQPSTPPPLLATPIFGSKVLAEDADDENDENDDCTTAPLDDVPRSTPSPLSLSLPQTGQSSSDSINTTNSGQSGTSRLRRLRGKPQVIDIMAEFSVVEAESMPPAENEEEEAREPVPVHDARERRIRFA